MLLPKSLVGTTSKRLREERHLTQEMVVAKAMIGVRSVGQIELGGCNCSLKTFFNPAETSDLSP